MPDYGIPYSGNPPDGWTVRAGTGSWLGSYGSPHYISIAPSVFEWDAFSLNALDGSVPIDLVCCIKAGVLSSYMFTGGDATVQRAFMAAINSDSILGPSMLQILHRSSGANTILAQTSLPITGGQWYWLRLTIAGTVFSAKTWADGTSEPLVAPCALNDVVEGVVSFLEAEARKRSIKVELEMDTPSPQVDADRILIEQVILNLARNAMEAMGQTPRGRRRLDITLRRRIIPDTILLGEANHVS